MLRSIALSLVLAAAAPLPGIAAQGPLHSDPAAAVEVTPILRAFHSALRRGDSAAAAAHFAEDALASARLIVSGWELVPERIRLEGETIRETGSYSRRTPRGRCDHELVEPKTQRQAREKLLCGARSSLAPQEGSYRTTWRRSPDGDWKVHRFETEAHP